MKRSHAPIDAPVTIERLQRGLIVAAKLVHYHGDVFAPIFERLERELIDMQRRSATTDRAKRIAELALSHEEPLRLGISDLR